MKKMNPGMMAIMAKNKMMGGGRTKMANGGGIESKGKTKGKMITMKKGGMGKAC